MDEETRQLGKRQQNKRGRISGTDSPFAELRASCTPGYFNDEGKVGDSEGWLAGFYTQGSEAFFARLRDWRASGRLEGLELS